MTSVREVDPEARSMMPSTVNATRPHTALTKFSVDGNSFQGCWQGWQHRGAGTRSASTTDAETAVAREGREYRATLEQSQRSAWHAFRARTTHGPKLAHRQAGSNPHAAWRSALKGGVEVGVAGSECRDFYRARLAFAIAG